MQKPRIIQINMSLQTQPYKGARDFYPEDKRIQDYMFSVMRQVVQSYGYEEYDAPILEPLALYAAKSGQEIVNEQTYIFTDRGGREVTIRPEMTPTVSRMVAARRQELAYPLRWFSIPNLWRYERPQKGRLREHWQLNVDLFGINGVAADYEIIEIADSILQKYGARRSMYTININSRKLMSAIFHEYLSLDEVQAHSISKLIDRMNKMDRADFESQVDALLVQAQRDADVLERLLSLLSISSLDELPQVLQDHESLLPLKEVMQLLEDAGITNAKFDITLMRGFDYYTDIIFEVFDTHPDNSRAIFGGGRYDGLVGMFGVEPVATIGFGLGDVRLLDFLTAHELLPQLEPECDAYVVLAGDVYKQALPVVKKLRSLGLNIAVDSTGRKLDKQIKTAVKKQIRYAIIIGEQELEDDQYVLKNLGIGQEEKHSVERIVATIKDYRQED